MHRLTSRLVRIVLLCTVLLTACRGHSVTDAESGLPNAMSLPATGTTEPSPTVTHTPPPSATPTPIPSPTATPRLTNTPTALPTEIPAPRPTAAEPPVAPTLVPSTPEPAGPLEVHFIDVGQGDAILILAPDGGVALIDGGESGSGVVEYLRAQGVERVDLMIATHPHADHIGGLVDVLRALPIEEVVTNGQMHTTRTYERFLDAIADSGALYTEVRRGDTLPLGALTFDVLHPMGPTGANLNDQSIVLRLIHGEVAFLFTGDAEREAEASMLNSHHAFRADVLKVGHHGSSSSSTLSFLAAVQPAVAVYSCGAGNRYGHPHAETLEALAAVGATIYGTDVNGTVVVISDGYQYHVDVERESQPRAPPTASTATPVVMGETTYTIQPGDTLSKIAAQFGVSVAALSAINDISDPSMIPVGQVLVIPSSDYVVPEPTAAPPLATAVSETAPQPTPVPEPTQAPAPAPAPEALTIEVVSLTSPIRPGANASLTIRTAPSAPCTITVYYKSGASQAAGLGPQNANAEGLATWRWKVGTRTTPGLWRIVVTAAANGQRSTLEIPFEVR